MPSANVTSSPVNDSLQSVMKNETVRYVRKGYGLIFAILIALSFFFVVPQIIKLYIWPFLLQYEPGNPYFFWIIMIGNHHFWFFLTNTMMYIIYVLKIPFFERYRIEQDKQWPWEQDRAKWQALMKKTALLVGFNMIITIPLATYHDSKKENLYFRFDMESFPGYAELIAHITFMMLCEDFTFYWVHRIFHHKSIYPYIHKIHHEHNNTVAISAEYAHPIEYLLSNLAPNIVGCAILGKRGHAITFYMYLMIRIFETIDGHCGYEFSWSPYRLLPFSASSTAHNYHHSNNIGNYGSFFTFWDTICSTNKSYYRYLNKLQKKDQDKGEKSNKSENEKKIN